MDSEEQALLEIYEAFCSFGAGQDRSLFGPSLDSAKFAKLCKDSRIVDVKQGITTTDVDIVFNKAKAKGDRRLNFEQFKTALALLGQRRFPQYDSASAYAAMVDLILEGNISVSGTFAQSNDVVDRLTDVSGYTGTHKNRFNADGTGKGLAGRESVAKGSGSKGGQVYHGGDVKDLSQILRPEMNGSRTALTGSSRALAGGSRASLASASTARPAAGSTQKLAGSSSSLAAGSSSTQKRTTTLSMDELANERKKTAAGSRNAAGSSYSLHSASGSKASLQQPRAVTGSSQGLSQKAQGGSVFDRLTDSKGYTGTHAQRFDEFGNGRGLGGRDSVVKGSGTVGAYRGGDVKELSQILRR